MAPTTNCLPVTDFRIWLKWLFVNPESASAFARSGQGVGSTRAVALRFYVLFRELADPVERILKFLLMAFKVFVAGIRGHWD
jgi:hypothetical protein